jgi:hypothetical protein
VATECLQALWAAISSDAATGWLAGWLLFRKVVKDLLRTGANMARYNAVSRSIPGGRWGWGRGRGEYFYIVKS